MSFADSLKNQKRKKKRSEWMNHTLNTANNNIGRVKKGSPQKIKIPFFPGLLDVTRFVCTHFPVKTLAEVETDRESIYLYHAPKVTTLNSVILNPDEAGIYKRGEADVKRIIDETYINMLGEQVAIFDLLPSNKKKKLRNLKNKLTWKLKRMGTTTHEVHEVLNSLRRRTFVNRESMNPGSHIPLADVLLSMETWEPVSFSDRLFYTYKVNSHYDPNVSDLNEVPLFKKFLLDLVPARFVPTLLDYAGYCLLPSFPRQKILIIAGREGIGKGTFVRLLEHAMGKEGVGRISIMKLLIPDNRFTFQNIEGKNVLVDYEMKRDYKRGVDFSSFNSLFGGDLLDVEKKFKGEINFTSKAKGILLGNLPLFRIENPAFFRRLLLVTTKPLNSHREIPNFDDVIWQNEGQKIVSLLLNRLKILQRRNYVFSNELTYDQTVALWEQLTNSVESFMNEELIDANTFVKVDEAYHRYEEFCAQKGIPPEKKHQFTYAVSRIFPKKQISIEGKRVYVFDRCAFIEEISTPNGMKKGINDVFGDGHDSDY